MSTRTATVALLADPAGYAAGMAEAAGATDAAADAMGNSVDGLTTRTGGLFSKLGNTLGNLGVPGAAAFDKIGSKISEADTHGEKFMQTMSTLGGVTLAAGAVGFAAVAAESVHLATDFQATVTSIAANANIPVEAAQKIGTAFLGTAGTTIYSGQQIASAYAGVAAQLGTTQGKALDASQAMTVMTAAMNLAEGSNTGLGSATTALSAVLQVYHDKASDAASVSDTLFNVSRLTDESLTSVASTVDKLHGRLGATTPSLQQVGTLMADLVTHGAAGRQAVSGLSTAITGLLAPTATQSNLLKILGTDVYNFEREVRRVRLGPRPAPERIRGTRPAATTHHGEDPFRHQRLPRHVAGHRRRAGAT